MRDVLRAALAEGYAVGYFEAWDQHSLEAVLEAAEEARSPVILGFGCEIMDQRWYDGGGQRRLAALGVAAAEGATVPTALLLNEAATFEQAVRGLDLGFNAVMLDTSHLSFEENIIATRGMADAAHAVGADVEGEPDRLPDASGTLGRPAEPRLTDPEQAARYVAETGVDALSVSVGNVHVMTEGEARIDFERLGLVREAVEAPLVIHGGTGFPDGAVPRAIALGVAKFNVGTILKHIFLDGIREAIAALPAKVNLQEAVGSRKAGDLLRRAKDRMKAEVMRRMALYGSAGKA
jgi:fructose-bisphosphate aldolase class II